MRSVMGVGNGLWLSVVIVSFCVVGGGMAEARAVLPGTPWTEISRKMLSLQECEQRVAAIEAAGKRMRSVEVRPVVKSLDDFGVELIAARCSFRVACTSPSGPAVSARGHRMMMIFGIDGHAGNDAACELNGDGSQAR
jgi:hypothetical protein